MTSSDIRIQIEGALTNDKKRIAHAQDRLQVTFNSLIRWEGRELKLITATPGVMNASKVMVTVKIHPRRSNGSNVKILAAIDTSTCKPVF